MRIEIVVLTVLIVLLLFPLAGAMIGHYKSGSKGAIKGVFIGAILFVFAIVGLLFYLKVILGWNGHV